MDQLALKKKQVSPPQEGWIPIRHFQDQLTGHAETQWWYGYWLVFVDFEP